MTKTVDSTPVIPNGQLTHFIRLYVMCEGEKFYLTEDDDCVEVERSKAHLFTLKDWEEWACHADIGKEELGQDQLMRLNGQPELLGSAGCSGNEPSEPKWVADYAKKKFNEGVRAGRGEAIAYLKGALGDNHPVVLSLMDHFEGGTK